MDDRGAITRRERRKEEMKAKKEAGKVREGMKAKTLAQKSEFPKGKDGGKRNIRRCCKVSATIQASGWQMRLCTLTAEPPLVTTNAFVRFLHLDTDTCRVCGGNFVFVLSILQL